MLKKNTHINTVVMKERQDKTCPIESEPHSHTTMEEEVMVSSLSCILERVPKTKSISNISANNIQNQDKQDRTYLEERAGLPLSSPSPSDAPITSPQPVTAIKVRDSTSGIDASTDCCNISIASAQPDLQDSMLKRRVHSSNYSHQEQLPCELLKEKPVFVQNKYTVQILHKSPRQSRRILLLGSTGFNPSRTVDLLRSPTLLLAFLSR